jgi:hypothetical protein
MAKKQIETGTVMLGDTVEDTVSGFKGVVFAITDWLYGCRRITVQPNGMHEGKPVDQVTFDEPMLKVILKAGRPTAAATGGERNLSSRRHDAH